jgi:hypothetical protein
MKIEKANISPGGGGEGADLGFPPLFGQGRPEEEEDPVGGEYPSPRREHFVVGSTEKRSQAGPRLARTAARPVG